MVEIRHKEINGVKIPVFVQRFWKQGNTVVLANCDEIFGAKQGQYAIIWLADPENGIWCLKIVNENEIEKELCKK